MLRCRPTRLLLKQEDISEYEAKKRIWKSNEPRQSSDVSAPVCNNNVDMDNKINKRQLVRDRVGFSEKL